MAIFRSCVAIVAALWLIIAGATGARANDTWCYTDPAVAVTTPGGNTVILYVTNGAKGTEHLASLEAATIVVDAVHSVNSGLATMVEIEVIVPNDPFGSGYPTSSVVSTGPWATGTIYDSTTGSAGAPMKLKFKLPVP